MHLLTFCFRPIVLRDPSPPPPQLQYQIWESSSQVTWTEIGCLPKTMHLYFFFSKCRLSLGTRPRNLSFPQAPTLLGFKPLMTSKSVSPAPSSPELPWTFPFRRRKQFSNVAYHKQMFLFSASMPSKKEKKKSNQHKQMTTKPITTRRR